MPYAYSLILSVPVQTRLLHGNRRVFLQRCKNFTHELGQFELIIEKRKMQVKQRKPLLYLHFLMCAAGGIRTPVRLPAN